MNYDEILDYEWHFQDARTNSIRGYLEQLLSTLWADGESFSGKRPFGNSGWDYDLYLPLLVMGAVGGEWDEDDDGYPFIVSVDEIEANRLVFKLIEHCFKPTSNI